MKIIDASTVIYTHRVSESAVRSALIAEAAEAHGLLTDGKLTAGVTGKVTFDGRRGTQTGQYTVELTFDRTRAAQASLPKPGAR